MAEWLVELTDEQFNHSQRVAEANIAERGHMPDSHGFTGDPNAIRYLGATAEKAVAVAFGDVAWGAKSLDVDHFGYDVLNLMVRSQAPKNRNSLILRPTDQQNHFTDPYIYVIVEKEKICHLIGWYQPACILDKHKTDLGNPSRPWCWSIPVDELHPLDLLATSGHLPYSVLD